MTKRLLILTLFVISCVAAGLAQQAYDDTPATREDVQRYLEVMHSREMMRQMATAMSKPLHQMIHDTYEKDRDKLPPDFEDHMNKVMDDMWINMPWEEMLDAMIPAYQRHLTKGDINDLIAFYKSRAGQKLLKELPTMSAEAMEAMMPILRRQMETMSQRIEVEAAQ